MPLPIVISIYIYSRSGRRSSGSSGTGELGYDGLNGTRKMGRHMQNLSYTYNKYLICIGLGPSISSVICKNPSYSGPSYRSSPVVVKVVDVVDVVVVIVVKVVETAVVKTSSINCPLDL